MTNLQTIEVKRLTVEFYVSHLRVYLFTGKPKLKFNFTPMVDPITQSTDERITHAAAQWLFAIDFKRAPSRRPHYWKLHTISFVASIFDSISVFARLEAPAERFLHPRSECLLSLNANQSF